MAVTYVRTLVTPSMARQWLDKNAENNRGKKSGKIPGYARDIIAGLWDSDSGETIKFHNDILIDGQNRLHAVILAGIPVWFDVAYTDSPRAMLVIDSGSSRTGGDVLKIADVRARNRASAVIRWVLLWDAGARTGQGGGSGFNPTHSEIVTKYASDPGGFDASVQRGTDCQAQRLGAGAVAAVAHYLTTRIDYERANSFFDQYVSGANVPEASPVLTLRNRLVGVSTKRITRPEQLALYARAWNAFLADETPKTFIIAKTKLVNANFPAFDTPKKK